jgi:uncharacterized repeat protein (TIGR03843 family)
MALPTDPRELDHLLGLMRDGDLSLKGLLPWSSNYTFLGQVADGRRRAPVVYKPMRGERPLWDFPRGTLAKRETAAYLVSRELTWNLVPPTVLRDGPHGPGSVQLFVEADQGAHFFTYHEDPDYRLALQQLALFDVITNNADRKGGHCLRVGPGEVVAIDQGLCFNVEPKLRTVIWDYAGEDIPAPLVADLRRLEDCLAASDATLAAGLRALLVPNEVRAFRLRVSALVDAGCFPDPPEDRRAYPWPPV